MRTKFFSHFVLRALGTRVLEEVSLLFLIAFASALVSTSIFGVDPPAVPSALAPMAPIPQDFVLGLGLSRQNPRFHQLLDFRNRLRLQGREVSYYREWVPNRWVMTNRGWPAAFYQMAEQARGTIHFNLDGIDIRRILKNPSPTNAVGRYTAWEFEQILGNKELYRRTVWYQNGRPVSQATLNRLGIVPRISITPAQYWSMGVRTPLPVVSAQAGLIPANANARAQTPAAPTGLSITANGVIVPTQVVPASPGQNPSTGSTIRSGVFAFTTQAGPSLAVHALTRVATEGPPQDAIGWGALLASPQVSLPSAVGQATLQESMLRPIRREGSFLVAPNASQGTVYPNGTVVFPRDENGYGITGGLGHPPQGYVMDRMGTRMIPIQDRNAPPRRTVFEGVSRFFRGHRWDSGNWGFYWVDPDQPFGH